MPEKRTGPPAPPQDAEVTPEPEPTISLGTFLETEVVSATARALLTVHRDKKLTRSGWREQVKADLNREVK